MCWFHYFTIMAENTILSGICTWVFNKEACVFFVIDWQRGKKKKLIDPCKKLCSLAFNQFKNDEKYYGKKLCKLN